MLKRNGFLLAAVAFATLLAVHHILAGITPAPLILKNDVSHQFYDWEDGRRYLATSDGTDCDAEKRGDYLNQRLAELMELGYRRSARLADSNGTQIVFEGFLRGIPVLYSPCEGTYLDPAFALGADDESAG
jgi:hypothetical protein